MAYDILCDSADREKWLELRRTGIGGSDAAGVLGLSKWKTPLSIAADKLGALPEEDETERMRAGHKLERVIAEWAAEEIGVSVSMYGYLLRSKEYPFMICTPDAQLSFGEPCISFDESHPPLQVKNTALASEWQDCIPDYVEVQVQHEMAITGAPCAYVAVLLVGNKLRWAKVDRREDFIRDVLIPEEEALWKKIQNRERIPADPSEVTRKAIAALWPKDTGTSITLPPSFANLDMLREDLREKMKALKLELDGIENTIRAEMQDATFGILPNGVKYSLKTQSRGEYTVKASEFRVMRRMAPKEAQ